MLTVHSTYPVDFKIRALINMEGGLLCPNKGRKEDYLSSLLKSEYYAA